MKAIRKNDGLVIDLADEVYDRAGNEYGWKQLTLMPDEWDFRELNHFRQYTAANMMQGMLNAIMQSTMLMEQYSQRAVREGYKTVAALLANDAVDYADALTDELVKRGQRFEP